MAMILIYVLIGVAVVLVLWAVAAYNHFVSYVNRAKEAWSDIDVQLKRRYDLIPNLVNAVKGYATHESSTFQHVTDARAKALSAGNLSEKSAAEGELTQALKSMFAVAEAYPELKANQNFLELQRELSDTENRIQAARRFYNGVARDFNTSVESFPSNILAKIFRFEKIEFFELADNEQAAKQPVNVSF